MELGSVSRGKYGAQMLTSRSRHTVVGWLLLVSLSGCFGPGNIRTTDLTEVERGVRVYHKGKQPECPYDEIGTVEATSGSAFSMGTYESSVAKMKREAAKLGATGVIVLDHDKNGWADQTTGTAIRCK
jgi:hypothetical protein